MIEKFTQWHKDRLNCVADYCGLSAYQMFWVAAIKGVVIGYLIGVYL